MEIRLPYSKSLLLRELALAYSSSASPEGDDTVLRAEARSSRPPVPLLAIDPERGCRDVEELRQALETLRNGTRELHIEEGGAPLRFLLALAAWTPGYAGRITVGPRLAQRPVEELLRTLRQTGARVSFDVTSGEFIVRGVERKAEEVFIDASESSQFVSALMLAAPMSRRPLRIRSLPGRWDVSRPYIDMTAEVMRRHGWRVLTEEGSILIEARRLPMGGESGSPGATSGSGPSQEITAGPEADWSAAAFIIGMREVARARGWNSAAPDMPGLLTEGSLQGDSVFPRLLAEEGPDYDLRSSPDLAMPLCATLLMLGRPFRMTGLETLPAKESDRLEAMRREFARFGYPLEVVACGGLRWNGQKEEAKTEGQEEAKTEGQGEDSERSVLVRTDGDHRIALAMKMMELDGWRVELDNPGCVAKSWPLGDREISRVAAELRRRSS